MKLWLIGSVGAWQPNHIELGLERVGQVWNSLTQVAPKQVITVAGTNGKGSTVEVAGVAKQGPNLRPVYVATYPCIQERIRVNGTQLLGELIKAFEMVESARGPIFLTYFEFLTLAAFVIFERRDLELWILEIEWGRLMR